MHAWLVCALLISVEDLPPELPAEESAPVDNPAAQPPTLPDEPPIPEAPPPDYETPPDPTPPPTLDTAEPAPSSSPAKAPDHAGGIRRRVLMETALSEIGALAALPAMILVGIGAMFSSSLLLLYLGGTTQFQDVSRIGNVVTGYTVAALIALFLAAPFAAVAGALIAIPGWFFGLLVGWGVSNKEDTKERSFPSDLGLPTLASGMLMPFAGLLVTGILASAPIFALLYPASLVIFAIVAIAAGFTPEEFTVRDDEGRERKYRSRDSRYGRAMCWACWDPGWGAAFLFNEITVVACSAAIPPLIAVSPIVLMVALPGAIAGMFARPFAFAWMRYQMLTRPEESVDDEPSQ